MPSVKPAALAASLLCALVCATPASAGPEAGIHVAVPEAPAAVAELLPPGTRRPTATATVSERELAHGTSWVERLDARGTPHLSGSAWIEVEYTVDPRLDAEVRDVLDSGRVALGHVVVMDAATGEVFAYVSTDPGSFPATRPYPTASLMKVVTAAAVLRNAPGAARRDCRYAGSPHELRPEHLVTSRGWDRIQSFVRALAVSNNQCFARLAVHDVGERALVAEMQQLGMLEAPAAGHPAGVIDPVRGPLSLGHLGSGMAGSKITPLGAARLAAALADGALVEPWWVAAARDANGAPLALPLRPEPRRVWEPEIASVLRDATVEVTERGTARRAFRVRGDEPRLGPIRVAGKTGTVSGRDPAGRYQWFIGLAPAEAPRVAIATVVVRNGPGGSSAALVAARTLERVFCEDRRCTAEHAERLLARSIDRDAGFERDVQAWQEARAAEIHRKREEEALARAHAIAAAHEVVPLDRAPRPIGVEGFDFPGRLRRKSVDGRIVLLVHLNEQGEVLDVRVDSSDLPDFEAFVTREVRRWRFTPPTRGGTPVQATARLPIPIHIN